MHSQAQRLLADRVLLPHKNSRESAVVIVRVEYMRNEAQLHNLKPVKAVPFLDSTQASLLCTSTFAERLVFENPSECPCSLSLPLAPLWQQRPQRLQPQRRLTSSKRYDPARSSVRACYTSVPGGHHRLLYFFTFSTGATLRS